MTEREMQILFDLLNEIRLLRKTIENRFESQPVTPDKPKFVTLKEASEMSGLSIRQLRRYIKEGVITRYGSKKKVLIFFDELEQAIRQGFKSVIDTTPNRRVQALRPVKIQRK